MYLGDVNNLLVGSSFVTPGGKLTCPLKRDHFKREISSSNHQFSGNMSVFRAEYSLDSINTQWKNKQLRLRLYETVKTQSQKENRNALVVEFNSLNPFQQQSHQPFSWSFCLVQILANCNHRFNRKVGLIFPYIIKKPLSNSSSSHNHGSGNQDLGK